MRFFCSLIFCCCFLVTSHTAQAQTCNDNMPASTPDSQLTDNGDGTITDSATGLMWKKCMEGTSDNDCADFAIDVGIFTWQTALQQPGLVNGNGGFAGHQDWRLPNIKELTSIIEEKCENPAINLTRFPNTLSEGFWSGSPSASAPDATWYVDFWSGFSFYNTRSYAYFRVRLVRGGY